MSMYEVGTKFIRIRTEQHYVIEKIELSRVKWKLFKKEAIYHLKQENGSVDLIVRESELKKLFKCVKQTNADRIRSMNYEELAEFLSEVKADGIYYKEGMEYPIITEVWKEWLQQEVEDKMGIACDVTGCTNNDGKGFCELEDIYISDAETGDPMCQDATFEEEE